jgi:hypothetical protein
LLFRTLCQSLQCCGKTRHAWVKSVVNDSDYYCQSSCLMSYFGQDLKAIAVIDWAINETESLVLIESKCFM